ncbi:histamine N-methyltransferase-like [Antedon mediterranea]|uniref:histamine N-methyltransferase-like n=1 Tax=Antedon mediterranea TaxID=105859 RepID=UPI003AF5FF90
MEGHKLFSLKMGRFDILKNLAESVFDQFVVKRFTIKDNIRSLGIGSAIGDIESLYIKRLSNHFQAVENTVVEPNAGAVAEYKSLTVRNDWKNVEYSWFIGTFQQFRVKVAGNDKKYHHISAIDSVYYLENLADDILFMYDILENGGIMMIMVLSGTNSLSKIDNRFSKLLQANCVTSKDIIGVCEENQLTYECYHHECNNDITDFFSSSPLPQEEKILLDFWIQMKDFEENVPQSIYDEVINFIKSPDCSIHMNEKVFFRNDFDMFFIEKKRVTLA